MAHLHGTATCLSRAARKALALALALLLLSPAASFATTVIPPTFQELVREAELVFEAEVIDTKSRISAERDHELIVTDVYFRVSKVLKGSVGASAILEFLGGTVGDRTFTVEGVPRFKVGDRDVIFAAPSRRSISPLVRVMHGRVRIAGDGAGRQAMVRRFDDVPLRTVAALGSSQADPIFSQVPAMSLSAFEDAVVAEVSRQKGGAR
jgi:hypothetical protein